jgi:aspartate racemase
MTRRDKTIGIVGGMGPAATVDFMRRIVQETGASDDSGHFRMLVDNNPKVPSRIAAIIEKTGPSPLPALITMAQGLEKAGADFLVMPCNTAHHHHRLVQDSVGIPFLSMIEIAADYVLCSQPHAKRVGFLASPAVRLLGVYEKRFAESDLKAVYPDEETNAALLGTIRDIKAGRIGAGQDAVLQSAAASLAEAGDVILIACTEFSLLTPPSGVGVAVEDTLSLLVRASIVRARGKAF